MQRIGAGYELRLIEWGEYTACFQRIPAGTEFSAYSDSDDCPLWGYVISGTLRFVDRDGSEALVSAGETYHVRAGHVFHVLEDTETVEFSRTAACRQRSAKCQKLAVPPFVREA